jgi:RNA polymerase sigma-70 factor, ECF subfamily
MSPLPSAARLVLLQGGVVPQAPQGEPPAVTAPDAELARALIRGDKGAPYLGWSRFVPIVRGNLRRLMGPGLDEDDLCQEVFLRFFQRIHGLRDPNAVRGFLFAICLRVTRRELRRRWLRRWLRLTDDGTLPEVLAGRATEDETGPQARDAVSRYYAILETLRGQARSLFVTRYVERLELTEVARLHGLSVSTTQRRLGRVAKRVEAMVRRDPVLAEIADHAESGAR